MEGKEMQDEAENKKLGSGIEYSIGKLQENVNKLKTILLSTDTSETDRASAQADLQSLTFVMGVLTITEPKKMERIVQEMYLRMRAAEDWEKYKR